jgi:hypothetical protein
MKLTIAILRLVGVISLITFLILSKGHFYNAEYSFVLKISVISFGIAFALQIYRFYLVRYFEKEVEE